MSFKIVELFSENIDPLWLDKVKGFCQAAFDENKHEARANMKVDNWQSTPESLLYLLITEKRFSQKIGGLQLLVDEADNIVALSGYYQSDFDPSIYIIGVRSWVLKQHRHKLLLAEHLLPYQLAELQRRNSSFAVISFNESTQAFAKLIERSNKSSNPNFKFFFGDKYPELYKDMFLWPEPVRIKNVKQWILIKKLSDSHFDWSQLNWNESSRAE